MWFTPALDILYFWHLIAAINTRICHQTRTVWIVNYTRNISLIYSQMKHLFLLRTKTNSCRVFLFLKKRHFHTFNKNIFISRYDHNAIVLALNMSHLLKPTVTRKFTIVCSILFSTWKTEIFWCGLLLYVYTSYLRFIIAE